MTQKTTSVNSSDSWSKLWDCDNFLKKIKNIDYIYRHPLKEINSKAKTKKVINCE